jgi:lipid-A-disaccharide synthase
VGKRVIKVKFISLVNLIMNREVVRELIQFEMNPANLEKELRSILKGTEKRQRILEDYEILGQLLAPGKKASEKAAAIIYEHAGHSK